MRASTTRSNWSQNLCTVPTRTHSRMAQDWPVPSTRDDLRDLAQSLRKMTVLITFTIVGGNVRRIQFETQKVVWLRPSLTEIKYNECVPKILLALQTNDSVAHAGHVLFPNGLPENC